MNPGALLHTFRELATEVAERDFSHIVEDNRIAALGIDSLGMLEIIGAMEHQFDIRIADEELSGIDTVRQLLELVAGRIV